MIDSVPAYLAELLAAQYGEEKAEEIAAGFAASRAVTLRANTLKADRDTVLDDSAAADGRAGE